MYGTDYSILFFSVEIQWFIEIAWLVFILWTY